MRNLSWLIPGFTLSVLVTASCGGDSNNLECGANTTEVDGVCVADIPDPRECATGTVENADGDCVPDGSVICETGTSFNVDTGTCDADITGCASGTIVVNGECRDPADVEADIEEAPEPNDAQGTPGSFTTPAVGASVTIAGCIEPFEVEGETVADFDSYVFSAAGPMLLDITVDGYGGAAGAFQLFALDAELQDAGFLRIGASLANDLSQRQVFLPKAGNYLVSFADSRSLFAGPAGGPGACYLASIKQVAVPAATAVVQGVETTGTFTNNTQFFGITAPIANAVLASDTAAPGDGALVDSVLMINNVYASSNAGLGDRDFGDPAANLAGGLSDADSLVYAIDPVVNISLSPVAFTHLVTGPAVVQLPTDGSTVSVPHPGDPGDDGSLVAFTVANDGDVKFLNLDVSALGDGSPDIDWFILDSNLQRVTSIDTLDTDGLHEGHFQFANAGVYYIQIQDFAGAVTDPYDFIATQIDITPTPVVVDTPFTAQSFGVNGAAFYTVAPGAFEWWTISGTPTDFTGDYSLEVFDREDGQIGEDLQPGASFVLDTGVSFDQVIRDSDPVLLMITDTGANAAATFDFSIANLAFTDLGALAQATPVNQAVTAGAAEVFYLATGVETSPFDMTVTGLNGFDPILVLIDSDGETVIDDVTGTDTAEVFSGILNNPELTFAVRGAGGVGGDYTIAITVPLNLSLTSSPALVITDDDPTGVEDIIANADACTVDVVQVDIDISHTFIGDLSISLVSPTGTSVLLHDESGGSADNIVGTYPTTLTPAEDLGTLSGEDAVGNWTLSLEDTAGGDEGTLNNWAIRIVCQ